MDGEDDCPESAGDGADGCLLVNEPPSAPTLVSPTGGARVSLDSLSLVIENATDPDGEALSYTFQFYGDAQGEELLFGLSNVTQGEGAQTTLELEVLVKADGSALEAGGGYLWRVFATDRSGVVGPPSALEGFVIELNVSSSGADEGCSVVSMPRSAPASPWVLAMMALMGLFLLRRRSDAATPRR